jgi:adenylate cyclase
MSRAAKVTMSEERGHSGEEPGSRRQRRVVRRLAAVLSADIRGYSTLMAADEAQTHRRVGIEMDRLQKEIRRSKGRVFSLAGDGLMAEFASSVQALQCALRVQANIARRNVRVPQKQRIEFRIGINVGEVVAMADRVGGDTVNVAARLEQAAEPGGILLSAAVFEQVRALVHADFEWDGEKRFKNIRAPVLVYKIAPSRSDGTIDGAAAQFASVVVRETPTDYRPSLAVLPFRSLQADQADAYFAEGMVDDIIRMLGGLKDLVVVSRSSTYGFNQDTPDIARIWRDLNVRYVLHGSMRRVIEQVRISVELDDAVSGESIWADGFDGRMAEIFDLQDRIALRTASSIAPHVQKLELRRASLKDHNSITAYDLTLKALDRINIATREALNEAQSLLQAAAALDPAYSAPLSHLAYLHIFRIGKGLSDDEHKDRAAAAAAGKQAVEVDRNDALGLAIYGHMLGYLHKDHETAMTMLDRAIAIGPSCALAWTYSSFTSGIMGDGPDAVRRARHAVRLSPIGPDAGCWHEHALSQAEYLVGNYAEAIEWGYRAARHGRQTSNLRCLTAALSAAGRLEEAQAVGRRLLDALPDFRLAAFRAYTPLKGQVRDDFVDRLRLAGLPE